MEPGSQSSYNEQIHACVTWMMQCGWSNDQIINAFEIEDSELISRNIASWRNELVQFQENLKNKVHASRDENVLYQGKKVTIESKISAEGRRVYLAAPYSHDDPVVREKRCHLMAIASGYLMKQGFVVFCPVLHCKPIAEVCDLPHDWDFWKTQDFSHLSAADELHVLMLDGWVRSKGVTSELAYAERIGKPIRYWFLGESNTVLSAVHFNEV